MKVEMKRKRRRKMWRRDFGLEDGRLDVGGVFFVSDFVLGTRSEH